LDNYVYATTSPIFVSIDARRKNRPADARYFWPPGSIDMMESTSAYPDWNSAAEKQLIMQRLADAKARFVAME